MFRFILLMILLLVLPDWYIWHFFTRQQHGIWRTLLLVLPTLAGLLCLLLLVLQVRVPLLIQLVFILLICVSVPKLFFVLIDGLGRVCVWNHADAMVWVRKIAMAVAVGVAGAQIYGTACGWKKVSIQSTDIRVDGLPQAFDGFRVVQISDIHLGTYAGDTGVIRAMVDSVNSLRPDLILFTGDMVNTASEEALPYIEILRQLRAEHGVMSVLGNHDYCLYHPGLSPSEQKEELHRLERMQGQMGWQLLLNEHRIVRVGHDSIYIAGVENIGKPPFPNRGDMGKAMAGIPSDACTILLSHDPWYWRHGVVNKEPVALALSGHTHAMQMQIGSFSPASWFMDEWGGLYRSGRQQLYVSTGVGGSIPYRLGAWPKIELITLRR